jgi:hypothetical protein
MQPRDMETHITSLTWIWLFKSCIWVTDIREVASTTCFLRAIGETGGQLETFVLFDRACREKHSARPKQRTFPRDGWMDGMGGRILELRRIGSRVEGYRGDEIGRQKGLESTRRQKNSCQAKSGFKKAHWQAESSSTVPSVPSPLSIAGAFIQEFLP